MKVESFTALPSMRCCTVASPDWRIRVMPSPPLAPVPHPAWRLLASPHAPLVASFLHRVFVAPNVRVMSEADLAEALEEEEVIAFAERGSAACAETAEQD